MNKIQIGLIGLGKAGLRHATAIRKTSDAELAAVADPADAARATADQLKVPWWSSYQAMLRESDVDAVIISLPHHLLAEAAITAAQHHKHILLEKPMGVTLTQAREVVDTCRTMGVRLMVNFVHRFRAEMRHAHSAIRSGSIGEPVLLVDIMSSGRSDLPEWVWSRVASGGGMMMYNGIHSLDRLAWLSGSPIASVTAAMGTFSYPTQVEDNLVGTLIFKNGSLGTVVQHKADAAVTLAEWQTLIYGTRGAIKIMVGRGIEIASEKERTSIETGEGDRFLGACQEFVAAIKEGRDPSPSGQDGLHALESVLALYESANKGTAIALGQGS